MEILRISLVFGMTENQLNLNNSKILNLFIKLKTKTMKCLNLYCRNYYDDFNSYHDNFLPVVWNLLPLAKEDQKYEKLIKELLDYYKMLFQFSRVQNLTQENLNLLINNLILTNMVMSSSELNTFEDDSTNFLKMELEEADVDSSKYFNYNLDKYHSINLLKNIIQHNKHVTDQIIRPLIGNYLEQYYKDPNKNWTNKIIAINLIFATMITTFAQRSKII